MGKAKMKDSELQAKAFRKLLIWQIVIYAFIGLIGGLALRAGIDASLDTFAFLVIAVAVNQYLPSVVHELYEINDQLAGRSSEFRKVLNEMHD